MSSARRWKGNASKLPTKLPMNMAALNSNHRGDVTAELFWPSTNARLLWRLVDEKVQLHTRWASNADLTWLYTNWDTVVEIKVPMASGKAPVKRAMMPCLFQVI